MTIVHDHAFAASIASINGEAESAVNLYNLNHVYLRPCHPQDHSAVYTLLMTGATLGRAESTPSSVALLGWDRGVPVDGNGLGRAQKGQRVWVADTGGSIVGLVQIQSPAPHTAHIQRVCVEPVLRQTLLAIKMLRFAVDQCRQLGYLKLTLSPCATPPLYERLLGRWGWSWDESGSQRAGRLPAFYLDLYGSHLIKARVRRP